MRDLAGRYLPDSSPLVGFFPTDRTLKGEKAEPIAMGDGLSIWLNKKPPQRLLRGVPFAFDFFESTLVLRGAGDLACRLTLSAGLRLSTAFTALTM